MDPSQHAVLYGKLRAAVLSRHFAINRMFRMNLFSETNTLNYEGTAASLRAQPAAFEERARWDAAAHDRAFGNPLMFGGFLMACLAVDYALGRADALRILRQVVDGLAALYKFPDRPHFAGYPVRWDAVSSDDWATGSDAGGNLVPLYCRNVPIGADGRYLYCVPFDDPRYVRPQSAAYDFDDRYGSKLLCRAFEPSLDEMIGLITGYDMVYRLVPDVSLRAEIVRQVNNLGDYLAEHGYMLVRPAGGFSGYANWLEFSAGRVFARITGNSYAARVDFVGALQQADVWNCVAAPIGWSTVGGIAASTIGALDLALAIGGLAYSDFTAWVSPVDASRALGIASVKICFDVWRESQAGEFALAYLLSRVPPRERLHVAAKGINTSPNGNNPTFMPVIGLTSLDDSDTYVRDTYLWWLRDRRTRPEIDDGALFDGAQGRLASAVACLSGAGADEEARLVDLLAITFGTLHATGTLPWSDDLPLVDGGDDGRAVETTLPALEYMLALSLAWLHARRQADRGTPVTTPGFPQPPDPSAWPAPAVPAAVLAAAQDPNPATRLVLPVAAIQRTSPPQSGPDGAALFLEDAPPDRTIEPVPVLPPAPAGLKFDGWITVPESAGDVDTGVIVRNGDVVAVDATGSIWAGVLLTGSNGPGGWADRVEYDAKFPLHGVPLAHPYCLLGKLRNYFYIGSSMAPRRYFNDPAGPDPQAEAPLKLRINDDTPGNGSGSFQCHVRVWGTPDLGATFVGQQVPASLGHGQSATAHITLRNTGRLPWAPAAAVRLGAQNPQDNTTWVAGARVALTGVVAPGGEVTFDFPITAPSRGGTYDFQWRMVQDGVAWFGDLTPNVAIAVIEDPACPGVRAGIAATQAQIVALRAELAGLDPRLDRLEIRQINQQLAVLGSQLAALKQQAAALGCAG